MKLSQNEAKVLKMCCDSNEKLTLKTIEKDRTLFYKSRFLSVDFSKDVIIIDEPSPETQDARPISKNQEFEIFFELQKNRFLFDSRLIDHTQYTLNESTSHAIRISLPEVVRSGDMREYFRVETGMKHAVTVKFNIYKSDSQIPVMSSLIKGKAEDYEGEILDISGGGFSLREKPDSISLPLEKGDKINARFTLREEDGEIEIWSMISNVRKFKETHTKIFGLHFLGKENNWNIGALRTKIFRYVMDRQRENIAR